MRAMITDEYNVFYGHMVDLRETKFDGYYEIVVDEKAVSNLIRFDKFCTFLDWTHQYERI